MKELMRNLEMLNKLDSLMGEIWVKVCSTKANYLASQPFLDSIKQVIMNIHSYQDEIRDNINNFDDDVKYEVEHR